MAAKSSISQKAFFRALSLALVIGALMLYVRDNTRPMATPYLMQALLFWLVSGTSRSRLLWVLPCLPAVMYHAVRIIGFWRADAWRSLFFAEIALLAVTYLLTIAVILSHSRPPQLRLLVLLLFLVCIGFGVWDIIDGWWVLMNHTWTPLSERISLFVFYYIPDTMFWIFPFVMLVKPVWRKK